MDVAAVGTLPIAQPPGGPLFPGKHGPYPFAFGGEDVERVHPRSFCHNTAQGLVEATALGTVAGLGTSWEPERQLHVR